MNCLLGTSALKWLLLITFCFLFTSKTTDATIYKSCQELRINTGSSSPDGPYSIELANGVAVSLFCKGMDTDEPEEYLNLPAGRSKNYASIYANKGVPNECRDWHPIQRYNISGKSEFDKVRFDPGTNGIIIDDFTYANKIGLNNIKYGTAGDFSSSSKKCPARGVFRIDLSGTPFIISKKIQWFWKGHFADGSNDSAPSLSKNAYIGCFRDKNIRAMPSGLMRSRRMNVNMCKNHCKYKHFQYAGLQAGQECWCGNSYKKYGPSKSCKSRCPGNKHEMCGGSWALSVYVIGELQFVTGKCGGYPGYCYPAQIHDKDSHLLLLTINPQHPCLKSVCGPVAVCLAIDVVGYTCLCPTGYSGKNCEKRKEIIPKNGICPPNYQAEICRCDAANCFGAKFQNGRCVTFGGKPQVVCRYGNPDHTSIRTINSGRYGTVSCPYDTKMISCSYWDPQKKIKSNGVTGPRISYHACYFYKCRKCSLQVQCMKYRCGCKNKGICDPITNQCHCRSGYTGELCEDYDYCSFWETSHKKLACEHGGICRSMPQLVVSATGGDQAGNRCIFPFNYQGQTFSRCVSDNKVGPPFACSTSFSGRNSYIDLGKWSPGPAYTILAWVKPTLKDSINRLIVGSISDCRDFGLGFQFGRFQTYYSARKSSKCTIPVSTYNYHVDLNKWYAVAVINTGRSITLMVNGRVWSNQLTYSHFLGNANGFYIGGGPYNYASGFKGNIKNVKIYNKAFRTGDVDKVFMHNGIDDSTDEVNNGLVGHYELGEIFPDKCSGIDHGLQDWIPETLSEISGSHCNISKFIIKKGTKVFVMRWDGSSNGTLEIDAKEIHIEGELTAAGAGYHGGQPINTNGADGSQGESHSDTGGTDVGGNQGGGGGGLGQNQNSAGGLPGGGGGHGVNGIDGKSKTAKVGGGKGGATYGTPQMHYMYLGSGGGSGGNAIDLTETPPGGAGGNGGGAIKLFADTLVSVTGTINVQGEDGVGDPTAQCFSCPKTCKASKNSCSSTSRSSCWDKSGPGGGGSGGSIYISGENVNIEDNHLFAMGGNGGQGTNMCGGAGGIGRIHVLSSSFHGRIDPKFGLLTKTMRKDKIKDFSHIGHTVGNKDIQINTNPVYLGCIKETKTFLMKHKLSLSSSDARKLTPLSCHRLCSDAGHIYSGTTKGNQCYCDKHVTTTAHAQDAECNAPCSGDKRQFCGGDGRVLVFGPKPFSYGRRVSGAMAKCESWCITADADTTQPKWGRCVDEESTVAMSIGCQCPKGKTGDECDEDCPQGTWGELCRNNCTCNGNCDPVTGDCTCKKGFHGDKCNIKICPPQRYGRNCERCSKRDHYGKDCKKCDCIKSRCNVATGDCFCSAGRTGDKCERVCPAGKWGQRCYRNCDCNHGATCEPIFGMCNCPAGYAGRKCEDRCPPGTYGERCGLSCPICSTDTCHHVTGKCLCDPGWTGSNCTEPCSPGTWDIGCAKTCDANCTKGCNPMEGFCCSNGPCLDGQYCDGNGTCVGEIIIPEVKAIHVQSASLGAGAIVGIVLVVIVAIMIIAFGITYFVKGRQIFSFMAAKYETQQDNVVLEGHFANPFYDRMNDASKPDEAETETKAEEAENVPSE